MNVLSRTGGDLQFGVTSVSGRPGPRTSSSVEAEFDEKAASYEADRLSDWYRAQGEYLLDRLENVPGPVVDVGCGTGWLLRRLVQRHPGARGIGLDLSGRMIDEARERARSECPGRLSFIQGDWEDESARDQLLELLDRPASLIVCVSAFHYFRDPESALVAMRRLLASGGRVLLLDRALDRSVGTAVWGLLHRYLLRDSVRFYRTSELVGLLEGAGFIEVEILGRINRVFWRGKLHTSLVLLSGVRGTDGPGRGRDLRGD